MEQEDVQSITPEVEWKDHPRSRVDDEIQGAEEAVEKKKFLVVTIVEAHELDLVVGEIVSRSEVDFKATTPIEEGEPAQEQEADGTSNPIAPLFDRIKQFPSRGE